MTDKRRRGFWGTLGCLVGLHDWEAFGWAPRRCRRCLVFDMPRRVRQTGNVVMGDMAGGDIVKPSKPNALAVARQSPQAGGSADQPKGD